MANWYEPTDEQLATYAEWLDERPPHVREVAERFPPWKLFRMESSGHRVTVHSFDERIDGTVTLKVNVTGDYNFVAFERRVFGIDPEDLTECELPAEDELLGASLTTEEEVAAELARFRCNCEETVQ